MARQVNEYPDWALKHKVKGTAIYRRNENLYLYKVTSKYNKETKKAQRITEEFLGKITEQGLIPPKHKQNQIIANKVMVREYGGCRILDALNHDVLNYLKQTFPNCYQELIVIATLRLIHSAPFKNIKVLYDNSYLSVQHPGLSISDKDITNLIRSVGLQRDRIVEFFKCFKLGEQNILFDLTAILNQSDSLDLNKIGYGSNFHKQINLLYSFNTSQSMPAYYRILPGNIREIKAFKLSIQELGLDNVLIIADKGFYSTSNITALDNESLRYLIPLKRNSNLIPQALMGKLDQTFFIFNGKPIWYISHIIDDKHKIILYLNDRLKTEEQEDYLMRIANKYNGYTMEKYNQRKIYFGTFVLITNSNCSEQDAYIAYKSRMNIEQMFDVFKNILHADRTYMRGEPEIEAWMFINHIAMMFYYSLYNVLKNNSLLSKYSPKDLLVYLNQIKKIKINDQWISSEITTKTTKLIEKIGMRDLFFNL